MESRNDAFNQGTISGSPELARKAMVYQAEAGGMMPGQNGRSADTYSAEQPYLSQALKAGY
jgi:hypothetical protein